MSYVSDFILGKGNKMICNFIAVLFFEEKIKRCAEEQQCRVSLADGYLRNLSPAEVSGSLLSLCGVKISFGVLTSVITSGGEKRSCLLPVTMFFYSACGVGKLKVFRAAELVLS